MKILSVIQPLFEQLLIEANLINGKDPYNGISLTDFLEQYTSGLNTVPAKQMFVKKLSRLLMADERFLYAVRELPPNAPAWAQQAMEQGDLVFFQPSDELKDNIENLSHYVASLEQDLEGADANAKAVAAREMQGFPKAESLDLLLTKVQEYFSRGSEQATASETEGMKAVLETPGGYVWYKLETPKAFYREGQTLSNCIGKNYTAENTKASKTIIYVLRDRANTSVVATRIQSGEMQEVKGKGNRPPLPRYMPAVQKLINTFNITLASGGKNDVGNSGYYFHGGILYSKPQAIAKLMKVDKMFDIPNTKVHVGKVVSELPGLISQLYLDNNYYSQDQHGTIIYQAVMDDGDPIVAVHVGGRGEVKKIIRLIKSATLKEAEEGPAPEANPTSILPAMISMLVKRGDIKSISSNIVREIYFQDGALWNPKTKEFSDRKAMSTRQYKPKQKGAHTLDVYEGEEAKQLVRQLQDVSGEATESVDRVKTVYSAVVRGASEEVGKQTDKVLIVVEYDNGSTALFSARGAEIDMRQAGYTRQGSHWNSELVRDGKTVSTLTALANEQGFKLPKRFQVAHGLSYREGQYVPLPELTPTEIPGDPSAAAFDLTSLDPMDTAVVLARVISQNDTKPHMTPFTREFKFRGVTQGLDKVLAGKGGTSDYFYDTHHQVQDKDRPDVTEKDIAKWTNEVLGTAKPTAIYRVNIKYGADKGGKVAMVVAGKSVTFIDAETLDHTWQSRNDYQNVSDQLNKFADANGLKFERSATKKSPQLRVSTDGKLIPAEALAKSRLEKRLSRDNSVTGRVGVVPFADGASAKKMSQEDYGTWSAHGIKKSTAGTPWEISNADGEVVAVVVVSREGKITRVFSNPSRVPGEGRTIEVGDRQLPVIGAVDASAMKYVKALSAEFGWTEGAAPASISPNSPTGRMLLKAYRYSRERVNIHRTRNPNQEEGQPTYVKGSEFYNIAAPLQKAGLVTIQDGADNSYSDTATLTSMGRTVADRLKLGQDVPWSSLTPGPAELSDEYARPAEQVAPVRAPRPEGGQPAGQRAQRQPMEGGGSKADLALQRFREMTTANNGEMPTRSAFIAVLTQAPFNMTPAGASTYQYNTKAKYLRDRGDINEHFTFIDFLTYIA